MQPLSIAMSRAPCPLALTPTPLVFVPSVTVGDGCAVGPTPGKTWGSEGLSGSFLCPP